MAPKLTNKRNNIMKVKFKINGFTIKLKHIENPKVNNQTIDLEIYDGKNLKRSWYCGSHALIESLLELTFEQAINKDN